MVNNTKISVITGIYHPNEHLFRKFLHSCLNQTLEGIQFVFIYDSMTIRDIDKDNRIAEFLNSAPRFKVIVLRDGSFDASMPHVNVGHVLSTFLRENNLSDKAINGAKDFLSAHITDAIKADEDYGKYVCLTNLGILFEKRLDFAPAEFLSNIAKNTLLFLHWEGVIRMQKLYFLDEGSKHFIDFRNTNYITI